MSAEYITRCVVIAADRGAGALIRELLDRLPGVELCAVLDPQQVVSGRVPVCDVALVCEDGASGSSRRTAEAAVALPGPGIVTICAAATIDTYREALAAGARGLVAGPPTREALADAIAGAARAARTVERPAGRVVAVCGAKGGSGATAVAVGLAVSAGALLVDLADGRAQLAELLGCRSDATVGRLAQAGPDLDQALESVISTHRSELRMIAGGGHELLELLPDGLTSALVRSLRRAHHLAVVDAGRGLARASAEAVAGADAVLLVTTPDAQSAAAARAQVVALERAGVAASALGLLVNRWQRRAELSVRALQRACGAPVVCVLPERPDSMAELANGRAQLDRWPERRLRDPLVRLAGMPPVAA